MTLPVSPAALRRLGLAAALVLSASAAQAVETPFARTQGAEVRLMAGTVKDGALEAGIEIRLAPGWKTYWRYPGDSGIPPRFDWSNSRNVAGATVAFPHGRWRGAPPGRAP
jgi:DsbC/DsbD-like thiol-disulfide interchange protein